MRLSGGYALSLATSGGALGVGRWAMAPIVAFGDSLTEGAGAGSGQSYVAQGGAGFVPPRTIANEGIGGQSASGIAVRQGGVPLLVALSGNSIPARIDRQQSWDFATGSGGWFTDSVGASAVLGGGQLLFTVDSALDSLRYPLAEPIGPRSTAFSISFDIEVPAGMTVRVSGLASSGLYAARNLAGTVDGVNVTASGHYTADLLVGDVGNTQNSIAALAFLVTYSSAVVVGTIKLDNVVFRVPATNYAVAVTSKSENILTSGSAYSGSAAATIAGVHGVLGTDAAGNWTFTRETQGPAVAVPNPVEVTLDKAIAYRTHTQWLWAGSNGAVDSAGADLAAARVAAMAASLPHGRYLVLGALPRPDRVAAIARLNQALRNAHGRRFIDVLGELQRNHDGSAGDLADVAAGLVPRSLRVDEVHLTSAGYGIVGQVVRARTLQFGG